jgi:Na+/melibiose symporter-like transporter
VISSDYNQRSRVYSFWQVGNIVGMIMVLALPTVLEKIYGNTHAQGMQAMCWFIVILLPLAIGFAARTVREPILASAPKPTGLGVYFSLFRNVEVRRILVVDLAMGLAPGITSALFFFFFEQVKGISKGQAGLLLLFYFLAGLVGAPLWNALSKRIGKHKTVAVACLLYTVTQTALVFVPAQPIWLLGLGLVLAGLPYSVPGVMLRSMMADVSDEERLRSGADRTGLLYALFSGTSKIGYALAVGVSFIGLDMVGFQAVSGMQNSASALLGLQIFYVGVPGLLGLFAAIVVLGYRLDGPRHAQIRDALALRDGAAVPEGPEHDQRPG